MAVWKDNFISPNQFSRPQKKLTAVKKVVIHWTANLGATAHNHFKYFNNLKDRYASAHFFVDKDEAICIIPLNEIAYHANDGDYRGVAELKPNANFLSVGIEMCVEKDGSFHPNTIKQTIAVAVELCKRYKLDPLTDIVRHYDITHKNCPAPWVKNSKPFEEFKVAVKKELTPPKPIEKPVVKPQPPVEKPVTKPVSKPVEKPAEKSIGNVIIEVELNIHKTADLDTVGIGTAIKGAKFPVYEVKNNMLRIGEGKWISAHEKYSKYTPNVQPVKPTPQPKFVLKFERTLKLGMQGADVKELQKALNELKFNVGTPDGDYGAKTKDAVARFQKVYLALDVDGIAGKKTIDKINSLLK